MFGLPAGWLADRLVGWLVFACFILFNFVVYGGYFLFASFLRCFVLFMFYSVLFSVLLCVGLLVGTFFRVFACLVVGLVCCLFVCLRVPSLEGSYGCVLVLQDARLRCFCLFVVMLECLIACRSKDLLVCVLCP